MGKYIYKNTTRLTDKKDNLAFWEREGAFSRVPYSMERSFWALIEKGDVESISCLVEVGNIFNAGSLGNLSSNDLRQAQYTAVSFATIATRIAVGAGIPMVNAYSASDEIILKIDEMSDPDEIYKELTHAMLYVTERIAAYKKGQTHMVNTCIAYISGHLHEKLTLAHLAEYCGVSQGHLSRRFHEETGLTLKVYINVY